MTHLVESEQEEEFRGHVPMFFLRFFAWCRPPFCNECRRRQPLYFNYVGDSILGFRAHLGAGVILSNVKLDHREIHVSATDGDIATGLTKFGAIVGDRTEIGCNAVINPGSVLGRDCLIYPGANFRGVLPNASVVKFRQNLQVLTRRAIDAG